LTSQTLKIFFKYSTTTPSMTDFVVLAEDPHEVDPDHIKEMKVLQTVVGG